MAFERKKPLLYADLFKRPAEKEAENMAISTPEGSSSIWSSSSQLSSPCGSSSSGFSTPLFSDFESEDGDFIAELTREIAERMLQDEDEEEQGKTVLSASGSAKGNVSIFVDNSTDFESRDNGIDWGCAGTAAGSGGRILPIQLKNQPSAMKEDHFGGGRRAKQPETAQPKTQRIYHHHRQMQYGARNGSGMQAVFLRKSGSGNGPSGTGVFMPRLNSDPAELKKKSGCSIVLMPTRVLQTLELHFKQRQQSTGLPLNGVGPHIHASPKLDEPKISKGHSQLEKGSPNGDEMQLPQEWTY